MTTDEIKDNGANKQQQWLFSQALPGKSKEKVVEKNFAFLSLMNLTKQIASVSSRRPR